MIGIKNKAVKKYRGGNITAAFGSDLLVTGSTSIPNLLLKYYVKLDISDSEMMLLIQIFRLRTEEKLLFPNLDELNQYINGDAQQALTNLLNKEILSITEYYDFEQQQVVEGLDFEPLYEKLSELWACDKVKEIEQTENILKRTTGAKLAFAADCNRAAVEEHDEAGQLTGQVLNVCSVFERELGRPLSPMEVARIRHWCEEMDTILIIEALHRAVMIGKPNFRYIDAILLEWRKNNLQTLPEVAKYERDFKQRRAKSRASKQKIPTEQGDDQERKKLYDALLMS